MQRKGPSRIDFGRSRHGGKGRGGGKGQESVHRRNLHIFAQPVIFFFGILRYVAYYLWLALSAVCKTTSHALPQKQADSQSHESLQESQLTVPEMAYRPTVVGPGEPALAKQKHHHRKAFEYISKALKIDEEGGDRGELFWFHFQCFCCDS